MRIKYFRLILRLAVVAVVAVVSGIIQTCNCNGWDKLQTEFQHREEAIGIVNKLKEIIEKKERIISTDIGIISMLNGYKEYRINDIIQNLRSEIEQKPIPMTILHDSKNIHKKMMELLKFRTMFIFIVEKVSALIPLAPILG